MDSGGGGGGSGGSIVLRARTIALPDAFPGQVTVKGGPGSKPSGGGGAGGRIRLQPLGGDWSGGRAPKQLLDYLLVTGGAGAANTGPSHPSSPGQTGSQGIVSGPPCHPGHGDALCLPCLPGQYSNGSAGVNATDNGECMPCAAGTSAGASASVVCDPCGNETAIDFYGDAHEILLYSHEGQHNCTRCNVGQRALSDRTGCEACPTHPYWGDSKPPMPIAVDRDGNAIDGVCDWACNTPFIFVDSNGGECSLWTAVAMRELYGLYVLPSALGFALLALCCLHATPRAVRLFGRRRGVVVDSPGAARTSLLSAAHSLQTLDSVLAMEAHRSRAKQHVARLYLRGTNSATQAWQLPPLPFEVRGLVSE